MPINQIQSKLKEHADEKRSANFSKFFKNSKKDIFLGVPAAQIKKIAKIFFTLSSKDILKLMKSNVHDERSLAHAILCLQFSKADEPQQRRIFNFYLKNRKYIQDWDAVDDSAPYIVGPYLLNRDKKVLYQLVKSKRIWDRRIAIVSTWWFIRQNQVKDTLKLAEKLLKDKEDLIHKATGWMLREVGKRNISALKKFLQSHSEDMPRTMLRYAIERFPPAQRKKYLIKKGINKNAKRLDRS